MTDFLRVLAPESLRGEICRLDRDDLLIGRATTADWRLSDPGVSRQHALVRRVPTRVGAAAAEIQDLGSTGGTWVNGSPVTGPRRLHAGDRVRLATVEFVYEGGRRKVTVVGGLKGAAAAVVGLGAVAGAILSIGSLWPGNGSPTTTLAKFQSVEAVTGVTLGEYQQRKSSSSVHLAMARRPDAGAPLLRGAELVAVRPGSLVQSGTPIAAAEEGSSMDQPTGAPTDQPTGAPTDQPTGAPTDQPTLGPTDQPPDGSTGGPTGQPGDGPTGQPTSPSLPPSVPLRGASGIYLSSISGADEQEVMQRWRNVQGVLAFSIQQYGGAHDDGVSVPPDLQGLMRSPNGKLLSADKAAQRIIRVLDDARPKGRREPLGVVVHAEVELIGFKHQDVMFSWSMWSAEGGSRLHGAWLNDTLAYRLVPGADEDATAVDIWVPIPKAHGPYYVRTTMRVKGDVVAEGKTGTFR